MHESPAVILGCIDCHGGNPAFVRPRDIKNTRPYSSDYLALMAQAHVEPRFPEAWRGREGAEGTPESAEGTRPSSSANPVRSYTLLNREDPDFIRFVNPGDLRIAGKTCGTCHGDIVSRVRTSMMTHGAQLWSTVLYNNGSYPLKVARFAESYSTNGVPQRLYTLPPPTPEERSRGVLDFLDPLPRWEITQMGNILRSFERGGKVQRQELEVGLPNTFEESGKPDMKLSDRGLGTQVRTDPVFLGMQKTRLFDPLLSFLGTNDHPGDYRSSGCTACHVIYANDRSPVHSGPYARFGHLGRSATSDQTISTDEPGHPIVHRFTRSIPSSQCVVCHMHPGTLYANQYLGTIWWDNETDGEHLYPREQQYPTSDETIQTLLRNPEGSAVRGLWSDLWPEARSHQGKKAGENFLEKSSELNSELDEMQLADFHGHGWLFRMVFQKDRKGRLLDSWGKVVDPVTPEKLQQSVAFTSAKSGEQPPPNIPVHLKDIHLERGMHCVDCHFEQDVHGDGKLYGEVRSAIEIGCIDCHGTITRRATLRTSGPSGGRDLASSQTPFGRRFDWRAGRLFQRSSVLAGTEWEVPQIADSVNPRSPRYNDKAAYAKTIQRDGKSWGDPGCPSSGLAHSNETMSCFACHTSWVTSCFGCHLPMRSNTRLPMLHNEGDLSRNWVEYNFQVIRDDVFMLGKDSTVQKRRTVPARSACAVVVGSQRSNREWIYSQQQTISSDGYSGQAFSPHFPHAVRKTETRRCTDCHVSDKSDNNAWMSQVLMQGTNFVNFLGRYAYVAEEDHGFEAVAVTERDEPQAVIGSYLHRLAYPDHYRKHVEDGGILKEAYGHHGKILDLQLRGEYLYVARGEGGLHVYDVANIDNKDFSERIVTAPVSPLGQSLHVDTEYATAVASPTTLGVDPTRVMNPINQEQPIHPLYGYLYVADFQEGLILVGAATLLDGDPTNNFLDRALAFNPDGILDGAVNLTVAGNTVYVCCKKGVVLVDISTPLEPEVVACVGAPHIVRPTSVAVQFRYAFVCDAEGLKVLDITVPQEPKSVAFVPIAGAHRVYVARTYAYVAAGKEGLVIVDVEQPEKPAIDQIFTAGGKIDDAHDVKVGMTNASVFAYVADGKNGLRVIQMISPEDHPGYAGFSPRPKPKLVATYPTGGPAVALSKGLDRDRAVDESGNQVAVFGRLGSRPFTLPEQQRLYLREGRLYTVTDEVPETPVPSFRARGAKK